MIRVREVEPKSDYRLTLIFSDGTRGTADLRPLLGQPLFGALRDRDVFARAHVKRGAVVWSDDLDIATEVLYALAHGLPHPDTLEQAIANEERGGKTVNESLTNTRGGLH